MNKVYGLILLFAMSVLLCSCRGQDNKHLKKEQVDQIENDIVFICNRQYDMNGLVNKGFFIDKFGNIGTFDFPLSEEAMEYANINELYTYLAKHYHEYEKRLYL